MKKHVVKTLALLTALLFCTIASALGSLPEGLAGEWQGKGIPKNNGTPIDLSVTIAPDGTGEYVFLQGGYSESFPFSVSAEGNSFSVDIPATSQLGKVTGTWSLEDGVLKMDITSTFIKGGSYSYTAECTKITDNTAETWICPTCGAECAGNFCENDATPKPAQGGTVIPVPNIYAPVSTPVVPALPNINIAVPSPVVPTLPNLQPAGVSKAQQTEATPVPAVRTVSEKDAAKLNEMRASHTDYTVETRNVLNGIKGKVFIAVWDNDAADAVPSVSTDTETGAIDFSAIPEQLLASSLQQADTVILIYPRYYEAGKFEPVEGSLSATAYNTATRLSIGRFTAETAYERAPETVEYHLNKLGFPEFDGPTKGGYYPQQALDLVAERLAATTAPEHRSEPVDADTWFCPVCGAGCTDNFCENDATPRLEPEEAQPVAVNAGDYVFFGSYPQGESGQKEPIAWLVLEVRDGKALLISRCGLEALPFNETASPDVTWADCTLRAWLNESFIDTAFTEAEAAGLVTLSTDNSETQGKAGCRNCGDTQDAVFLLSYAEADRYFGLVESRSDFRARTAPTEYALEHGAYVNGKNITGIDGKPTGIWWLRSAGIYSDTVCVVDIDGFLRQSDAEKTSVLVRPSVWVDLKKLP